MAHHAVQQVIGVDKESLDALPLRDGPPLTRDMRAGDTRKVGSFSSPLRPPLPMPVALAADTGRSIYSPQGRGKGNGAPAPAKLLAHGDDEYTERATGAGGHQVSGTLAIG